MLDRWNRLVWTLIHRLLPTALFLSLSAAATAGQGELEGGSIEEKTTEVVEGAQNIMLSIASIVAVIAFIGLAFMYMGSSLPVISKWKKNNPDAFSNVMIGLAILLFASGGGVAFLVGE